MRNLKQLLDKNKMKIFNVVAIIVISIFAISISPKGLQNDTFYTVTIGELITQNGIDMKDHFSWNQDLPYTYPHWLYDVGMYYIYNLWNWDGIYISTCILAIILGLCIYGTNSKLSKNKIISFFITIGSLYLLKDFIAARAQLVTFILFILEIFCIEKYLENRKIKYAVFLVIIQTLIANLHSAVWPFSFILYLPYIAEYIISEIIRFIKKKAKIEGKNEEPYKLEIKRNTNVRWLILVMIITGFTGLITPLGFTPYNYTYLTMEGNTMKSINEHLPLTLIENIPVLCALLVVLVILIFTKTKIRLSDLFMIGGLTYLMFMTRRQSSMFALIGSVVLTRLIVNYLEIYGYKKFVNVFFVFILITVFSVSILGYSFDKIRKKQNANYISESTYPVQAAEWILENLDVNNIKLYNEYNYGSYLLYKGIPVFIYSRADLYAPEFNTNTDDPKDGRDIFSDFINVSSIGKYYGEIFEKYGITHALMYGNSKMNMLIKKADSEKYKLIYSDDNFVLYEILNY